MMTIDTVYNMDCIEGMKGMEQDSVDCIITSPPYYNAKEYSQWRTYEDYRQHLAKALHGMLTVLKPGHFCIINISCVLQPRKDRSDYSRRYAIPFHTMQLAEMMGFEFVDDIIWLKPEGAAVNRGQKFYHLRQPMTYHANSITEYVLVFRKPGRTPEEVSKEYSEEIKEASRVDDRYFQTNVWPINPVYDQAHPAIYPPIWWANSYGTIPSRGIRFLTRIWASEPRPSPRSPSRGISWASRSTKHITGKPPDGLTTRKRNYSYSHDGTTRYIHPH